MLSTSSCINKRYNKFICNILKNKYNINVNNIKYNINSNNNNNSATLIHRNFSSQTNNSNENASNSSKKSSMSGFKRGLLIVGGISIGIGYLLYTGSLSLNLAEYYIIEPLLKDGYLSINSNAFGLGGQLGLALLSNSSEFRLRMSELDVQTRLIQGLLSSEISIQQKQAIITCYVILLSIDAINPTYDESGLSITDRLSIQPDLVHGLINGIATTPAPDKEKTIIPTDLMQFNEISAGVWICLRYLFDEKYSLPRYDFFFYPGLEYLMRWYIYTSSSPYHHPVTQQIIETLQVLIPFINKHYDQIVKNNADMSKSIYLDSLFNAVANVGFNHSENNNPKEAIEALKLASRIQPNNGLIQAQISKQYQLLNEYDEAVNYAAKALKSEPNALTTVYNYYYILKQQNKLNNPKVRNELVSTLQNAIDNFTSQIKQIKLTNSINDLNQIQQSPEYIILESAYLLLLDNYENLNRLDLAQRVANDWAQLFPLSCSPHFHLARLSLLSNNYEMANKQLNLSLQLDANKPQIYYLLAKLQYKNNSYTQAQSYIDQAKDKLKEELIKKQKEKNELFNYNNPNQTTNHSNNIIAQSTNINDMLCLTMPELHYLSYKINIKLNNLKKAQNELKRYLIMKPDSIKATIQYTNLLKQSQDLDNYYHYINQALNKLDSTKFNNKSDPYIHQFLNNVQTICADNNGNNNSHLQALCKSYKEFNEKH